MNPFTLLSTAGRCGPALLCGGVGIGLLAPTLADLARPFMPVAVFVFTLGAFLKVDGPAYRAETLDPLRLAAILLWSTFGVPLATFTLVHLVEPRPDLGQGLILCSLAPPVGSAAAIAAMLGLSAPLALLATVAATLVAPFYLPLFAPMLAGADLAIEPVALAGRLSLIIGAAGAGAFLVRRFAGSCVTANPHAMTGVSVLGLLLVAIGAMHGMQGQIAAAPGRATLVLGVAFAVNVGFQALSTMLFAGLGRVRALTMGLVCGNRNVTLIWAAATPFLAGHPETELILAMSVFPIFMLPVLFRRVLLLLDRIHHTRALILPRTATVEH